VELVFSGEHGLGSWIEQDVEGNRRIAIVALGNFSNFAVSDNCVASSSLSDHEYTFTNLDAISTPESPTLLRRPCLSKPFGQGNQVLYRPASFLVFDGEFPGDQV
jgi:hypothetical protein